MNTQHLITYLSDHAALSVAGIELAKRCYSSNKDSELGAFLADLIPNLEHERESIKTLLHKLQDSESMIKNIAAWGTEKIGRFKLNNSLLSYSPLSRVLELETLVSGLHAQSLMWQALENYAATTEESAFQDIDCSLFARENRVYRDRLEAFHQKAAYTAFMA